MKNDSILNNVILVMVIVGLLIMLLNPFNFWMPSMAAMTGLLVLIIAFVIFSVFAWQETPRDEREHFHMLHAGRIAFLVGTLMIMFGIAVEVVMHHEPNLWLVTALVAMVAGKLGGRIYIKLKN